MEYVFPAIQLYAVLTVIGQVILVALVALLLTDSMRRRESLLSEWIRTHGLLLMFIVALLASLGSLFFSEIGGLTPCKLCWFQRIFMYPQAIILLIAILRKDRGIASTILVLSLIGIVIAGFHYAEQVNAAWHPVSDLGTPCDASGVSCAKTPTFAFGYITIPLMAATAFGLNIFGSLMMLRRQR